MAPTETTPWIVPMQAAQLVRTALVGLVSGFAVWLIMRLLSVFVFDMAPCDHSAHQCASSMDYASAIATVIGAGAMLFGLSRFLVFRSLLIAVLVAVAFWGLGSRIQGVGTGIIDALTFALGYAVSSMSFAWIMRIRPLFVAGIISIGLVIVVRLMLFT